MPDVTQEEGRSVAGNVAELVRDVAELAELQVKLFAADSQAALHRALLPALAILVGLCLVLGCVPVVLLSVAHALRDQIGWTLASALAASAGAAVLLAALVATIGWRRLRRSFQELERSRMELARNAAWVKQALGRNLPQSAYNKRSVR